MTRGLVFKLTCVGTATGATFEYLLSEQNKVFLNQVILLPHFATSISCLALCEQDEMLPGRLRTNPQGLSLQSIPDIQNSRSTY